MEHYEGSTTPRPPKQAGRANNLRSATLNDGWLVKFGRKQVCIIVSRGAKKSEYWHQIVPLAYKAMSKGCICSMRMGNGIAIKVNVAP